MAQSEGRLALVTGASSGIGRELARLHASKGGDLLLIARRKEKLDALSREWEQAYGVRVRTLGEDLSDPDSVERIASFVEREGLAVADLINNAGYGGRGLFHEQELARNEAMVQLNVTTLMALTRRLLPGMIERGDGRLLHVASTAGLVPGPLQAVYYATKAFVVSFSQALAEELRGMGVSSTVLCPGPVATEFAAEADLEGTALFKAAASPVKVAKVGYRGMEKGSLLVSEKPSYVFGLRYIIPLLPRRLVLLLSRKSQES